jgi:hypothetical protein
MHAPESVDEVSASDVAARGLAIEMGVTESAEVPAKDIGLISCVGSGWESHRHSGHNG